MERGLGSKPDDFICKLYMGWRAQGAKGYTRYILEHFLPNIFSLKLFALKS